MPSSRNVPFPPTGSYIQAIRTSSKDLRESSGIIISLEAIQRFLHSAAFSSTFKQLSHHHGLTLPLNFPSQLSELNLISVLALINLGSGYRIPLHAHGGRGAWDSIRALVLSLFITSSAEDGGDLLSASAIKNISIDKVAGLMQLPTHVERPHETIPGVVIGELGGPLYDLVKIVTSTLNETGEILVSLGYPDLGSFVLETLKEGERVGRRRSCGVDIDAVLEKLVLAIPAFRDMTLVNGQPVYIFKKALFLLHGISERFSSSADGAGSLSRTVIPFLDTSNLPVFADNVLPSILVHLGIIDVSRLSLPEAFGPSDNLNALLSLPTFTTDELKMTTRRPLKDGPTVTESDAYILRAAAVDACEQIVEEAHKATGKDDDWLRTMTLPNLDGWLWAGAKDRPDYRELGRFVLRDTAYF
ncbi:hypothetical protein K439DRAFT_1405938 [Ramaria rubella]|nr:hypothetical protein K439DRAFT_1405938 [Ramaria rubella]